MNNDAFLKDQYTQNLLFILIVAFVVIGTGIGIRDPWPADEPRFVEVAREMVNSGNWFFPMRGGELYPDKPPVFMWSIAFLYWLTGNLSDTFLIPNFIAGLITVLCVFDLGAKLWNVKTGRNAALLLMIAPQFIIQAKAAQIDMMVACWITIGMYGFIRHFFIKPSLNWYIISWIAMGLGIITKGVGFLPILALLPIFYFHFRKSHDFGEAVSKKLFYGPLAMLVVLILWLLPVLYYAATSDNPDFAAYRDNILFKQTGERYAKSLGHREPFYYFVLSVIPTLWFPLYLFFANGKFWRVVKDSTLIKTLLMWVVLVVIFFSISPGKRGVYILPALPMLSLAIAAVMSQIETPKWFNKILSGIILLLAILFPIVAVVSLFDIEKLAKYVAGNHTQYFFFFISATIIWAVIFWRKRFQQNLYSFALALGLTWVLYSSWGYSLLNPVRTPAKVIMTKAADIVGQDGELGLVKFKEQFLLFSPIGLTHFSYLSSTEEQYKNAWHWMSKDNVANQENKKRYILTHNLEHTICFDTTKAIPLGHAHRRDWFIFDQSAMLPECGAPKRIVSYHIDGGGLYQ
ncbi:glycosyltransferase family 39 protein [Vibrio sp. SS-MA-C1-2]|uniref:ArnT family glycosyltransferase n=1 Tax=Vibrio sp. SS-MA-C1-2 TaxID=2908646 RepID=UPI001F243B5C|nr:glycosyltransferase family 39 protein [Vibrio sp. SS-MA-C1-2]UJF18217.1 glycosyltransferase family 39 protein [Vibrio sp. SS-MA-C1-2]